MSARKIASGFSPLDSQPPLTRFSLSAHAIRVRKNGIEFHSAEPITAWKEMTVDLESPHGKRFIAPASSSPAKEIN